MKGLPALLKHENLPELMRLLRLSKGYFSPIQTFISFCREHSLPINPGAFVQATEEKSRLVKENRISPATYNLFIVANRQFILRSMEIAKASAVELYAAEKMMRLRSMQVAVSQTAEESLSKTEIEGLKRYATKRGRLIIELLQVTALRISEALNLPIRMEEKKSYFQANITGKGGRIRTVFVPRGLYLEIMKEFSGKFFLLETKKNRKLNRSDVYKMMKIAAEKAVRSGGFATELIEKTHPHALRHAWATEALNQKKDLYFVSQYLSHSSIETTAKFYIKRSLLAEDALSIWG